MFRSVHKGILFFGKKKKAEISNERTLPKCCPYSTSLSVGVSIELISKS